MMVKQETCFGAAFKCKGAAESVSTPSSFKKFCIPHFCAINYTKQNLPLRPFVHPSLAQLILHKYALSKQTFARQLVILEGFIVGIKWIIIEVISWKHDYHLRLPLVWKMDPAFLQFKLRSSWRSAFGVGLSVAFRLLLCQPVVAYCGSPAKANVESCVAALDLGMCSCIAIVLHTRSGGRHTMGGVRTHIRALHTSWNPRSLQFNRRISLWIPHQTCWNLVSWHCAHHTTFKFGSNNLCIFLLWRSVPWLFFSAAFFFLTLWHCYWLENIILSWKQRIRAML